MNDADAGQGMQNSALDPDAYVVNPAARSHPDCGPLLRFL